MKHILFALIFAVQSLLGAQALAAPCTMSTLSTYFGLGSAGCTIGNFKFSNFVLLLQPTNSVPFSAVSVTPVAVGTTAVGLDFGVNASANAGMLFEDLISYRVTGIGASLNGASLFLAGSSAIGDGAVTVVENLCINGLFLGADGVSGCIGATRNLIVVVGDGFADPPASLAFPSAASLLSVVTDIAVDGGTFGAASLRGSASNRFAVAAVNGVPEPAALLIVIAALLALGGSRAVRFFRVSRLARDSAFRI